MFPVGCSSCGVLRREAEAIKYPSISPRKLWAGREVHLGSWQPQVSVRLSADDVTQTTSVGKPLSAPVSTQTERLECAANNGGIAHAGLLNQLVGNCSIPREPIISQGPLALCRLFQRYCRFEYWKNSNKYEISCSLHSH